jgi:hypothetical protein
MMTIRKALLIAALLAGVGSVAAPSQTADAGPFYRVAPVRRVAARAALPPYPLARRAVVGPVYRPFYRPYYRPYASPYYGGYRGYYGPGLYGPGISIGIGF